MSRDNETECVASPGPLAAVRGWLREACPLIDKQGRFNASYLGARPTEYALALAGESHRQDVCGGDILTLNLVFLARLPFGEALGQNLAAADFFAALSGWLRTAERAHAYPALPGYAASRLTVSNAGLVLDADAASARYQLQFTLIFEEV